jgi:hypothetical protein
VRNKANFQGPSLAQAEFREHRTHRAVEIAVAIG